MDKTRVLLEVPFSVLIVDDHAIIRRGIRELMIKHFSAHTIKEASSRSELQTKSAELRADLVLLDLQLSDGNSMDLIPLLLSSGCGKVLVYSMSADRVFAPLALGRGASGFVNKGTDEANLIDAVKVVCAGDIYLDPGLAAALRPRMRTIGDSDVFNELSEREIDVMNELLTGASVKEIAIRLDLQSSTVATYKARLFDKLGVSNVIDMQQLVQSRRT